MKELTVPTQEDEENPQEKSGIEGGSKKQIAFYTDSSNERTFMRESAESGKS